ncbi:MAG: glycosyltransferase family 2 protein, partial [Methylococcus sp.]
MTNPVISFVVIGRNEGERLTRCLESIGEIRGVEGEVDVIYVDSASTDDSVQRAQAEGARVLEVRPERPSAALGRNAGWKEALAPFILFLDGDTILHPDFPAQALAAMQDPSVAVVWGHRREIQTGTSVFNRVLDLDWIYPAGLSEF